MWYLIIFLKIKNPIISDKEYYRISKNDETFILYDPITKTESKRSTKFELDKIKKLRVPTEIKRGVISSKGK